MMLGWMASLGLPLLAGFVAEILSDCILDDLRLARAAPRLTLIITAVYT
ncbi:MAG: hypothetical protein Ct9H300mP30_2170 [Methanobacteriota archaeon]|nr:MAG: hypothetical protein Ct9H300mP30_2170 [Euryarchaeota archaeon]